MDIIQRLKEDLEALKEQCEEEEIRRGNAEIAKREADDLRREAEKHLQELEEKVSEIEDIKTKKKMQNISEMQELQKEKDELMKNMGEINSKLKECTRAFEKTRNTLQVNSNFPHKNVNYTEKESGKEHLSDISYRCQILIQTPYVLQGGQALLTFEDEEVAQGVISKGKHKVQFSSDHEVLRAYGVETERTVKFEINMNISDTKVEVSNLPADLPEDTLKDKLELTFYKSNIGGGEIESVDYNGDNNSACITYMEKGVAQRVLKRAHNEMTIGTSMFEVGINPVIEQQLNKLEMFSGICQRTVLLTDIKNQTDSEDDIKDLIEIHFQKPSNGGGEVECLAYSSQKKMAYFEEEIE